MPNDELIASLEALRDGYSQRQRAANALLTALKGTTSALGKAGRALGDYAGQSVSLDTGRLAQAQEAVAQARVKIAFPLLRARPCLAAQPGRQQG